MDVGFIQGFAVTATAAWRGFRAEDGLLVFEANVLASARLAAFGLDAALSLH